MMLKTHAAACIIVPISYIHWDTAYVQLYSFIYKIEIKVFVCIQYMHLTLT